MPEFVSACSTQRREGDGGRWTMWVRLPSLSAIGSFTVYILYSSVISLAEHYGKTVLNHQPTEDAQSPMMIDTFLAKAALDSLKANLQSLGAILMIYENHSVSKLPTELAQDTFQKLHQLSQDGGCGLEGGVYEKEYGLGGGLRSILQKSSTR